ncbi:MAG: hypothetical protein GX342_01450 [Alcaligenaceae bacterium]|jgi:hypothetical protein|nr:hypothetical protein [Alcaligenaceae bacterium]
MIRYRKFLAPFALVTLLTACGEKQDDPERALTVIRFNFINACTFYAGNKNANFCGCAFDQMVDEFGQSTVIRLGDVSDESELSDPEDVTTFRAMHEYVAGAVEGVCKDFVHKEEPSDSENKTFFQKLIPGS